LRQAAANTDMAFDVEETESAAPEKSEESRRPKPNARAAKQRRREEALEDFPR